MGPCIVKGRPNMRLIIDFHAEDLQNEGDA
jgi:hypothetical protein